MPITQAGRQFTAVDIKRLAGDIAALLLNTTQNGGDFRVQLESWPDADLVLLGLTQEEVNVIKGFYVGDLPAIAAQLQASSWIKQLVGTGV